MAISQKVKKEYLALVAELNKHNDLYHNQDSPETVSYTHLTLPTR